MYLLIEMMHELGPGRSEKEHNIRNTNASYKFFFLKDLEPCGSAYINKKNASYKFIHR
jgi:hypothetical protein